MALFNKRQVGYIKALAGVGKHKTYIHSRLDTSLASSGYVLSSTNSRCDTTSKKGIVHVTALHTPHAAIDSTSTGEPDSWQTHPAFLYAGCKKTLPMDQLGLLDAPVITPSSEGDNPTTLSRVGPDFYLDSTHIRMRFTMPDFQIASSGSTKQPHYEYRLIMFRPRKPVEAADVHLNDTATPADRLTALKGGASYLNFHYDLFNGYVARPVGLQGWRGRMDLDGDEFYSGYKRNGNAFDAKAASAPRRDLNPPGEPEFLTMDDYMTLPLNDADYIVKCDERFFLGPEHGKSHYEKNVKINWTERGSTPESNMAEGLPEGFNCNWYIMLLATSNDGADPNLNVLYRGTTYVESS